MMKTHEARSADLLRHDPVDVNLLGHLLLGDDLDRHLDGDRHLLDNNLFKTSVS
jgi:hypothetical protein